MNRPPGSPPYQINTLITISTLFTGPDGVTGVDPSTVSLFIVTPAGVETAYTYPADITRNGPGAYQMDLVLDQSGPWIYKWEGTGAVEITSPDAYMWVEQSAVLAG